MRLEDQVVATPEVQKAFAEGGIEAVGKLLAGKLCEDHKKPILSNWLDLPVGSCFCGEKLED
jgi:hypothetical protein